MGTPFYRADFKRQLTGSRLGPVNCNSASGAMLVDQATLGLKDPSADEFRRATGDFTGGVGTATIGSTCELDYGVDVTTYDQSDGYTFSDLVADLKRGKFAVVNGDYDQVPQRLAGSKTFDGLHSEFWHRVTPDGRGIVVGDPLNDGRRPGTPVEWVVYPMDVARAYVNKLDRQVPGEGIHAVVMKLKRVRARPVKPATNVRAHPTRQSEKIGSFGGTQTLVWGGKVIGENVGGNRVWYRVWLPSASRIGYCHSSVVATV